MPTNPVTPRSGLTATSDGTVVSNISGSTAIPTGNSLSAVIDHDFSATEGAVLYRGAAGWLGLGPGTSGNVLQTNGANQIPSWVTPSGGGLSSIADAALLSNISGSTAVPVANTLSATIDHDIGSAQGDILYRGSSTWGVLAPGTSGNVLQTNGAGSNPTWVTPTTGSALLVNAKNFGATGNGSTDDTAAIQSAIDSAYSNQASGVYLPAGKYKISSALFLDAPSNLRSSISTPTIFNFSMALIGDPGLGNHESFGTQIQPTASSFVALWVGPGQGMSVKYISINGPAGTHKALLSTSGCGIAIAGGSGGASRVLIEGCGVTNYYYGIAVSFNGNGSLGDSNTLLKIWVDNCNYGVSFLQAQNFINNLYDCNITDCGKAVYGATTLIPINVVGGNYSNPSASRKKFTISSVSTLSSFSDTVAGNSFTNYTFTATVTSPDALMQGAGYGACSINTTGYGVIPLKLNSFNSGTGVATFQFWSYWAFSAFGLFFNIATSSDLQTEVRAATTLYACEWATIFSGGIFSVKGIHVENPSTLTTLINASRGTIERCYFNYDIAHSDLSANSGDDGSLWFCQQCFPFIVNSTGLLRFTDNTFNQLSPTESVIIDVGSNARSIFFGNDIYSPNVRYCSGGGNLSGPSVDNLAAETKIRGHGEWDINPWPSQNRIATGYWANFWTKGYYVNQCPARGYKPDTRMHPRLTPAQLTAISGGPGALGTYPPLHGEAIYEVIDYSSGALTHIFARSAHQFYSYGQNLTTTNITGLSWSYKGQSSVVRLNALALSWMFPGLKIILNNGGGNQSYMVTGVHTSLGYIDVNLIDDSNTVLVGTKTTTYTGTLITQEAYTLAQYP